MARFDVLVRDLQLLIRRAANGQLLGLKYGTGHLLVCSRDSASDPADEANQHRLTSPVQKDCDDVKYERRKQRATHGDMQEQPDAQERGELCFTAQPL